MSVANSNITKIQHVTIKKTASYINFNEFGNDKFGLTIIGLDNSAII